MTPTVLSADHGAERASIRPGQTLRQALRALREACDAGADYRAVGGVVALSDGSYLYPRNASPAGDSSAAILGRYEAIRYDRHGATVRAYRLR